MKDAYDKMYGRGARKMKLAVPTRPHVIEDRLRAVAGFTEAGADMEDGHAGDELTTGAMLLFENARLFAHAPALVVAVKSLMRDYCEQYGILTDWQYGKTPATPAYKAMVRLLRKIEGKPVS